MTGASSIQFNLSFLDRGSISGEFNAIERPAMVDVSWFVQGFGRPDELSRVFFSLTATGEGKTDLDRKSVV